MSWFCSHVSATARLLASTPVAESNESREWWLKSGFLSCVLQSCRSVIGQLLPRGHDFAFAASLSAVGYLPECAPVLVGAGGWRRSGAIPRFGPPFDRQPLAIIRPDRLAAGLVPVHALAARCDTGTVSVSYGRALPASILGAHRRPVHELELVRTWRGSVAIAASPALHSSVAPEEYAPGALRGERVLLQCRPIGPRAERAGDGRPGKALGRSWRASSQAGSSCREP